jgi:hypothetical protein
MSRKMVKNLVVFLLLLAVLVPVAASGQSEQREGSEHKRLESSEGSEHNSSESSERGEHSRDEGVEGSELREESGLSYKLDETYDFERKGSRLILNYDDSNNVFVGTIENITNQVLDNVRIEIHLSNGIEIGPTTPIRLSPGEKRNVTLPGSKKTFIGWTPHAEVGAGEHSGSESSEGGEKGQD